MTREESHAYVLKWLKGEHDYQLGKFKHDEDWLRDAGVAEGGYWYERMMMYLHRAHILGLDTPAGRQALAKFVATATDCLATSVRLSGPLPQPGVTSGSNLDKPMEP